MMHRTVLGAVYAGVICAGVSLPAQVMHAPDGGSYERLQSIDVPPKAGAPFRAVVVTSWKRRLEDGTEITAYNRRTIARDSSGRVFQERRFLTPTGNIQETAISELDYLDPTRNELTVCVTAEHRCLVHPSHVSAAAPPAMPASVTYPNGTKITRESLGDRTIGNLQVAGSREIMTTARLGDAEPTVKEFWYSERLGINVVVKRFEPRGGAQDFSVEQIDMSEPDARLFQPPQDFQMVPLPAMPKSVGVSGVLMAPPPQVPVLPR